MKPRLKSPVPRPNGLLVEWDTLKNAPWETEKSGKPRRRAASSSSAPARATSSRTGRAGIAGRLRREAAQCTMHNAQCIMHNAQCGMTVGRAAPANRRNGYPPLPNCGFSKARRKAQRNYTLPHRRVSQGIGAQILRRHQDGCNVHPVDFAEDLRHDGVSTVED